MKKILNILSPFYLPFTCILAVVALIDLIFTIIGVMGFHFRFYFRPSFRFVQAFSRYCYKLGVNLDNNNIKIVFYILIAFAVILLLYAIFFIYFSIKYKEGYLLKKLFN